MIKVQESELAKLEADADEVDTVLKKGGAPTKVAEPKKEAKNKGQNSTTSFLEEFSCEVGSWFATKWNGNNTTENIIATSPEHSTSSFVAEKKSTVSTTKETAKSNSLTESLFSSMFNETSEELKARPKNEEGEIATAESVTATTKETSKPTSQLGCMFVSMFSEKSKEQKPDQDKKVRVKATALTPMDEDESETQKDDLKPEQTTAAQTNEFKPTGTAAKVGLEINEDTSASNLETETTPEAGFPKSTPPDESRDAFEEIPNLGPVAPAKKITVEGKSTLASPASISAPESEIPKPIKLLKTPFKFYKAASMKEDPAVAALAATSFADQYDGYSSIQTNGVTVCKHDPSAAANADILEQERVDGVMESQPATLVDSNAELKRQGIVIVETE